MVRLECKSFGDLGRNSKRSPKTVEAEILMALIKEKRTERGLTHREISKRLGFVPSTYGTIERGDRVLDVVEFVQLAEALEMEALILFQEFMKRREAVKALEQKSRSN